METVLDPRSKMFSGIWLMPLRTPSNSTSGQGTQTSTQRTKEILSQMVSMDSTLRNLLFPATITSITTTVSKFELLTYIRTVNNENSQKWWWNYERQEANSTKQFYDRVAKNVTLPSYNYDDKEPQGHPNGILNL